MNVSQTMFVVSSGTLLLLIGLFGRSGPRARFFWLMQQGADGKEEAGRGDEAQEAPVLERLKDRLGRAGYLSTGERRLVTLALGALVIAAAGAGAFLFFRRGTELAALLGGGVGLYCGFLAAVAFLRWRTGEVRRDMLYQLPLLLEGLVLLVESGLGVLPAVQCLVAKRRQVGEESFAAKVLGVTYELSAHGLPFGSAAQLVSASVDFQPLRHVLLHLDLSNAEGGEIIPSLRSLSDYAHTEWRLSVETRVRRLENLVVFPVFTAVLGLMLLTASVPIVPVLDFFQSLKSSRTVQQPAAPALETRR